MALSAQAGYISKSAGLTRSAFLTAADRKVLIWNCLTQYLFFVQNKEEKDFALTAKPIVYIPSPRLLLPLNKRCSSTFGISAGEVKLKVVYNQIGSAV